MKELVNPNLFHGKHKKTNFFEGWYFKLVNKDESRVLAFIPGIALGEEDKHNHSFVQVLDGNNTDYTYCRYSKNSFSYSNTNFKVQIDNNEFSLDKIKLDLVYDNLKITGIINFKNIIKWKDTLVNPGSMGFYNYLPFMECYAQVCAVDGDTSGELSINGETIDFNGGKVYIEKNWGKSFPTEWLWIQCNSFTDNNATLTCSLGEIPFPIKNFSGFLIGVTVGDKFYKFTTINRSDITLSYDNSGVEVLTSHKDLRLLLKTSTNKDDFMLCYGPKNGSMSPYVKETLIGTVYMKLDNIKTGEILYEGIGINVGVEYGGLLMNKFD